MKKNLWMLLLACAACMAWSCSDDDPTPEPLPDYRVLTFEDADYKGPVASGRYWSSLIDDPQYGGDLLYSMDPDTYAYNSTYSWYDAGNTELTHSLCKSSWMGTAYWNGGHAVSNYIETDIAAASYEEQLSVATNGGHSGTNFCVHNGYMNLEHPETNMAEELPVFAFADGVARTIEEMWVAATSYQLNFFAANAKAGTWMKAVATGYDAAGARTGTAEIYLEQDGSALTEWTQWSLAGLGKVVKVEFNIFGCPDYNNEWGLFAPAYFAYDDVKVLFE